MTTPEDRDAIRRTLQRNAQLERDTLSAHHKPKRAMHPNSLLALELHRKGTQLDARSGVNARRCAKCKQVAVRGSDYCKSHGGQLVLRRREKERGIFAPKNVRRNVMRLLRHGEVPRALLAQPAFLAVAKIVVPKWFGLPSDLTVRPDQRHTLTLLMREMIEAWLLFEEGDAEPWTRAIIHAQKLGVR